MAEPRFADDDDLPRTLRRERDARERERLEQEARERERELREAREQPAATGAHPGGLSPGAAAAFAEAPYAYDVGPAREAGTVRRLEVPFLHLVLFFMKAVLAAIPALLLLTVLLWGVGQGLKAFFPELRHFEIVIKPVR